MPIDPEYFRLSQMLQPLLGAMQSPDNEPEQMDTMSRMNQIYTPEHTASDRLNQMIDTMPQRNNPGIGRKILAGLASGGDPANVERALYSPYHRELADWKEQLNPAVQAANFERADNINERQLANMIALQEGRDRTFTRQSARDAVLARQGDERIAQSERRTKSAEARLNIARDVAKGGTIRKDEDSGKVFMVYRDGTTKEIPDLKDMTREEILDLQQGFALERIEETGKNRATPRDRMRTEVIDDPENPGKRILVTINMDTNEVTPATIRKPGQTPTTVEPTVRTEETEANKIAGVNRRALQLKVSNPKWASYIKMKGGKFESITTPGLIFGPTPEMYNEIYKAIYGTEPSPESVMRQKTTEPNTSTNKGTTRADGKTHVKRKSDGVTGWVTNPDPKLYEVIP